MPDKYNRRHIMKLAVCSLFRDSQKWHGHDINQVDRYFNQLQSQGQYHLEYHLVEGNSADDTYDKLQQYSQTYQISLHKCEIKGSEVESTANSIRLSNLSKIGNVSLKSALATDVKHILWIESDLIIQNDFIDRIMKFAQSKCWDDSLGVCPITTIGPYFYDTWAFKSIDGQHFTNVIAQGMFGTNDYVPLQGFGCCALLNADNIRKHGLDFGNNCFRHLCDSAIRAGLKLWCDPTLLIAHPDSKNVASRWI